MGESGLREFDKVMDTDLSDAGMALNSSSQSGIESTGNT